MTQERRSKRYQRQLARCEERQRKLVATGNFTFVEILHGAEPSLWFGKRLKPDAVRALALDMDTSAGLPVQPVLSTSST